MLKGADLDKLLNEGYGDAGFNDPVPDPDAEVEPSPAAKAKAVPKPYARPPVLGAAAPAPPGTKPEMAAFNQAMDETARAQGYKSAEEYDAYLKESGAYKGMEDAKKEMEETQLAPGIKKAPAYMPPGAYPGDRTKLGKAYDKEVEEGPPVVVKSKPAVSPETDQDHFVESTYVKQSDKATASRCRNDSAVTVRLDEGRNTQDFDMGSPDLPWALEVSLKKMKVGDIMDIVGHGEYACTEREKLRVGAEKRWRVELVDVRKGNVADKFAMSSEDRVTRADELRLRGNDLFKKGRIRKAMDLYEQGSSLMDVLECEDMSGGMMPDKVDKVAAERNQRIWACQKPLLLNWALILIKLGRWAEAERKCTEVLMDIDKLNVKALFRRGQCNIHLGKPEQAKTDLERAAELDTSIRPEVDKELEKVGVIQQVVDKKDLPLAKKVVDGYIKKGDERSHAPPPKENLPPHKTVPDRMMDALAKQEEASAGLDNDTYCRQREAIYNQFCNFGPAAVES
mmetsp:Transcript_83080/g.147060  ORF Transcript_83080/g.147060 Transcript_83080/m.147060 type:complete len:510 (+) Transcript_83080:9-1538(+)